MRRVTLVYCLAAITAAFAAYRIPHSITFAAENGGVSQRTGTIPITTRSDSARAIYLRGRALVEALKLHEGQQLFEQAVTLDPTFALAEYSLASTAPTAKERSEHLQKALALANNASPGERLLILGLQARRHADRVLARQLAESLVVLYPRDERAHSGLAILYGAQQEYSKAIAEYQEAIDINPNYSIAYNQLGYANRSAGNMAGAEAAFRKYIALVPDDPNPYDSYAELLMKMGRFDESIAQYKKALSIDPHFGGSYVGIAADNMFAGRYDAAIAELEAYYKTARDDGERRTALQNEAMVYVDQGETDKALHAMEHSYDIARAGADTASMAADGEQMAEILLNAGRLDPARDRFRQSHDLLAASGLSAQIKQDDDLARHYDLARLALARHDVAGARAEANAYLSGATARQNDARVREAHELNGRIALEAKQFDGSLAELGLADQENPAVMYVMAQAQAGKGDGLKSKSLVAQAAHANILPTFPYVFTRAALASATGLATSQNVHGTPR